MPPDPLDAVCLCTLIFIPLHPLTLIVLFCPPLSHFLDEGLTPVMKICITPLYEVSVIVNGNSFHCSMHYLLMVGPIRSMNCVGKAKEAIGL